jgi:hypothetical protein
MLLLIYIGILLAILFVGYVCVNTVMGSIEARKSALTKNYHDLLVIERNKVKIAERGLRQIANGISGNPVLEAQVILDDISNVKEIV